MSPKKFLKPKMDSQVPPVSVEVSIQKMYLDAVGLTGKLQDAGINLTCQKIFKNILR